MKKIFALLIPGVFLSFASCRGPQGPEGIPGPQGEPGGLEYAAAFELSSVNFTPANRFQHIESFGFDIAPADVPLVYILWGTDDNGNEIWRPLPQTAYLSNGRLLTYNFDFNRYDDNTGDFSLFLDGNISDFSTLDPAYLNNQVFRIVVVPSIFLGSARMADRSYETITASLGISDSDFIKRGSR